MNKISAADNHLIDIGPDRWRLLLNGEDSRTRIIVEAAAGQPLRYVTSFARTRRLPGEGILPVDTVRQVVLGWSQQDESWHLGLVLARGLADSRGSRWCEIAHWPDPEQTVFANLALEAGESLAATLGRPFGLVRPSAAPAKPTPAPSLPSLPLEFELWTFVRAENGALEMQRARQWLTSRLLRSLWYTLWVVVYIVLSVTTLNTDLALPNAGTMLPNPELLPYLGLAAAVVLSGMVVYILYELITQPDTIVVDPVSRSITAYRGRSERWRYNPGELAGVYVTQVVNRRGKKRHIYHGELNLHLTEGKFHKLLQEIEQQGNETPVTGVPAREMVTPLTRVEATTDLQAAGLHIAETLGDVPCFYDQRTR